MNKKKIFLWVFAIALLGVICTVIVFSATTVQSGSWVFRGYKKRNGSIYKFIKENSTALDIIYDYSNTNNSNNAAYDYYCINGGVSFSGGKNWNRITGTVDTTYTGRLQNFLSIDPTTQMSYINSRFAVNNGNTPLQNYRAFKWIVENMYVETGDAQSEALMLENINGITGVDISGLDMELVKCVQQAIIWRYVKNVNPDYNEKITNFKDVLKITIDNQSVSARYGALQVFKLIQLYNNFLSRAEAAKDGTSTVGVIRDTNFLNNYQNIQINEFENTTVESTGTNTYKAGPYKIGGTGISATIVKEIDLQTTLVGGTISNVKIRNASGTEITNLGVEQIYYIHFTTADSIGGKIFKQTANIQYKTVLSNLDATAYYVGNWENSTHQQLMEITKRLVKYNVSKTNETEIEKDNVTDLALTKEIIEIDEVPYITDDYVLAPLKKSGGTDRTYMSNKLKAAVKPGSEVKFRITVYNELASDGIVKEVKDFLSEGLQYEGYEVISQATNSGTLTSSIDNRAYAVSYKKPTVTPTYDSVNNVVTFSINGADGLVLEGFNDDTDTITCFYIDVICTVKEDVENDEIMYNRAEISNYGANVDGVYESAVENNSKGDRDSWGSTVLTTAEQYIAIINGLHTYLTNLDAYPFSSKVDKNSYDNQDDDDFVRLKVDVPDVDLALFKTIVGFERANTQNKEYMVEDRYINITANSSTGEIVYSMKKDTYSNNFGVGDKIHYGIDIYNEGETPALGYEIKDYLPSELTFCGITGFTEYDIKTSEDETVETYDNDTTNNCYYYDTTNNVVYIKLGAEELIPEYTSIANLKTNKIRVVTICEINNTAEMDDVLTNIAEISQYKTQASKMVYTKDGIVTTDITGIIPSDLDSTANSLTETQLADYEETMQEEMNNVTNLAMARLSGIEGYFRDPGIEDDDDFERIILNAEFDLALRKFVTKRTPVEGEAYIYANGPTNVFSTNAAANLLIDGTILYNNPKIFVPVKVGDRITYTLRVYNEGYISGYANEITDYLPVGLELAEDSEINETYGWEVDDTFEEEKVTKITTNYLQHDAEETNLILALGVDKLVELTAGYQQYKLYMSVGMVEAKSEDEWYEDVYLAENDGGVPFYRDVQVECVVTEDVYLNENALDGFLINVAEITNYGYYVGEEYKEAKATEEIKSADKDSEQDNVFSGMMEDISLIKEYFSEVLMQTVGTIDYTLVNENTLFKGLQDDDDFEILRVPTPTEIQLEIEKMDSEDNSIKYNGVTFNINGKEYITATSGEEQGIIKLESTMLREEKTYEYVISEISVGNTGILQKLKNNLKLSVEVELNEEQYKYEIVGVELQQVNTAGQVLFDPFELFNIEDTVFMPSVLDNGKRVIVKAEYNEEEGTVLVSVPNRTKKFDLALQKFITRVGQEKQENNVTVVEYKNITNRTPEFSINASGKYVYAPTEATLGALEVVNGDVVVYTIRVYNEGELDGYADKIMDDIPEYLEYLPQNQINKDYEWQMLRVVEDTENVTDKDEINQTMKINGTTMEYIVYDEKTCVVTDNIKLAKYVTTTYLSKEKNVNNILEKFDEEEMEEPDYKDVQIAFKVKEPKAERVIINYAQITEDNPVDVNGEAVDIDDEDSTPNVWEESPRDDDQDIEMIRVKEFDLALKKCVSSAIVIEDGVETIYPGNESPEDEKIVIKVDLPKSKVYEVVVKFKYTIRVYNEGNLEGYVKEITDYIPEGLKFVAAEEVNTAYGWEIGEDGKITTNYLKDTLLKPGEYKDVEIMFTWINDENNLGTKVNIAEISEDFNEFNDVPDIDSTPNNFEFGEDDIDTAEVLLSPTTGVWYMASVLVIISLGIIAMGVVLIRITMKKI